MLRKNHGKKKHTTQLGIKTPTFSTTVRESIALPAELPKPI